MMRALTHGEVIARIQIRSAWRPLTPPDAWRSLDPAHDWDLREGILDQIASGVAAARLAKGDRLTVWSHGGTAAPYEWQISPDLVVVTDDGRDEIVRPATLADLTACPADHYLADLIRDGENLLSQGIA